MIMHMRKLIITLAAALVTICAFAAPKSYELKSPDGKLCVNVEVGNGINYTLTHESDLLLDQSHVGMSMVDGTVFGEGGIEVMEASYRTVDQTIDAFVYKKAKIEDRFNEVTLNFNEFSVVFRAYDDGFAYRFISHLKQPYEVKDELAQFNFAQDWNIWVAYVSQHTQTLESQFYNSFESLYTYTSISQWNKGRLAFLPMMVDGPNGKKIVITESDLMNYPGMYLHNSDSDNELSARFAPYPKEAKQGGHNNLQVLVESRENYIAKYDGPQEFPWRIVAVSENDVQMADNDMVYRLADPADPAEDWSWVKPGKVAWDWWHNWNIDGVDFISGINNDTYKFYIDFASANGIEYIILDEGWAVNKVADLFQVVPEIDLEMLVKYASERNVGLILWAGYWAFDRDMEKVCEHYSKMGIKGFKVDFMDRDDQYMVEFHRRAAETAAKYHLMLDFHGTYKPAGLQRTYPNVINFEGVFGLEQVKWGSPSTDQVTYDVTFPYIRMMAGPIDYTQGAMRNASRHNFRPVNSEPMSQGTRCRQLAEYVVFESPLNMLCDSPSNYMREKECLEYIAQIPTVWDETKGLCGEVGKYIVMARRRGDVWYVGGMTDWSERGLHLDLDFLPEGDYIVEMFVDGANAYRIARDYKKIVTEVSADGHIDVIMAPGGGFAMKIYKK